MGKKNRKKIDSIVYSNKKMISVQDKVSSQHKEFKVEEVFTSLSERLDNPNSCYEFYNSKEIEFIKIVIDIDLKTDTKKEAEEKYIDEDVISKTEKTLVDLFGTDIDIVNTSDHRRFRKPNQKRFYYKKSYHFIVENKKINPILLGTFIRKNKNKFKYPIDTSIYRNGDCKFRLPLTIKEEELETRSGKKSYMKMNFSKTVDNFKKYCITLTEGLDEVKPIIEEIKEKEKEEKKVDIDIWEICDLKYNRYNEILEKYNCEETKKEDNKWVSIIKKCECPFDLIHTTNRSYITLNFITNSIYIRCYSARCAGKFKMLLDNVFKPLQEFDLSIFMKLKKINYQKQYLEKRVIYLSDTNKYKQIKYDKHNNKFLEDIDFYPISKVTTILKNDNEVEFGKIYSNSIYKKIYKNTNFYPNLKDSDKHYYNEFQGFGYEKILDFDVDKNKVYKEQKENLNFYLHFMKMYICNNDEKVLDYFLSLLSFYIKYPYLLNHIILVLYSNEQGTGKSSFLDFFKKVIGVSYCVPADMEQVVEKHSNLAYKKIINIIEELSYDSGKNYSKKLKNKSQAETTILNEKNEPMRTILNFVHYIITTNEYRSIPLEPTDRRHFILEFTKIYNNDEIVNRVDDLYFNDEFIYTFGNYLRKRGESFDFSRIINWEKKRPITELFKIMIKRDSIDTFFTKLVRYEFHDDSNITTEECYDYYIKHKLEDFSIVDDKVVIKKLDLFEMYERKTEHTIKFRTDNFYTNIIEIKKMVKSVKINDEMYLEFDMFKIKNNLKLNNSEIKIKELLKIVEDDEKPIKIKITQCNKILKR